MTQGISPTLPICNIINKLKNEIKEGLFQIDKLQLGDCNLKYNMFNAQVPEIDKHVMNVNSFFAENISKIVQKINQKLALYKETVDSLSTGSDGVDPRINAIATKVNSLKSRTDIDREDLLTKIDKCRGKIHRIYGILADANLNTKNSILDLRIFLNTLESAALVHLKETYSPQLVVVNPTILLNNPESSVVVGKEGELKILLNNPESSVVVGKEGEPEILLNNPESSVVVGKEGEPEILLNNPESSVAVEKEEPKREPLSKEEALHRLKALNAHLDPGMMQNMPQMLKDLQGLMNKFTSAEEKLCLKDVLQSFSTYASPVRIGSETPDCLLRDGNFHLFLPHRVSFHLERVCLQSNLSVASVGAREQVRALQCLQVELLFVYLYNFVGMENSLESIRTVMTALEKMKLDEQDLPSGMKNLAHAFFTKTYKDYLATWNQKNSQGWTAECPMWTHPHDPSFKSDFGRNAITGSSSHQVNTDFKRNVINEFLKALRTTWGLKNPL